MTISTNLPVTSVASALGQTTATTRTPKNELDKDAFLQLMVTQMRYQDPSSPMDTSQMMAQTSQMTTVEQLTKLTETSQQAFAMQQRLGAASMIGKQVTWNGADGSVLSGSVGAVTMSTTGPVLRVGTEDVALESITSVVAPAVTSS